MFFEPFEFRFERFSKFPEFGHPIQQLVLPLAVVTEDSYKPLGTGFMITSNGLLMTAKHVIKEGIKHGVIKHIDGDNIEYELRFFAIFATINPNDDNSLMGGLIPITKSWICSGTDIGFCLLNSPVINGQRLTYPVSKLSPGVPKVGEHISGLGYYNMKGDMGPEVDGNKDVTHILDTAATSGEITDIHYYKRDNYMLNFPSFQTNAQFEPGMSGGPIFNESGSVCGVICSGFSNNDQGEDYITHGSLIWPSLGTRVTGRNPVTNETEYNLIYDLVQKGFIKCDDTISHIKIENLPNGDRNVNLYNPYLSKTAPPNSDE